MFEPPRKPRGTAAVLQLLQVPVVVLLLGGPPAADAAPKKAVDAGVVAKDAGVAAVVDAGTPAPAARIVPPEKKTERQWKSKCGACHGPDGKGATEKGRKLKLTDLATPAFQKGRTDAALAKAIAEGVTVEKDGVKKVMDAYGPELSRAEIDALVAYVRWLGR